MKKILSIMFVIVLVISLFACKKKEAANYSGTVMVYAAADIEDVKALKEDFENAYPGIVVDYFYASIYDLKNILIDELELEEPSVDVIYVANGLNKNDFNARKLRFLDETKAPKDNEYVGKLALVKNSVDNANGELLVNYLLSK